MKTLWKFLKNQWNINISWGTTHEKWNHGQLMCQSPMKYKWKFSEIHFHRLWKLHDKLNHVVSITYGNLIVQIIMYFHSPWKWISLNFHLYFIGGWHMNCPWFHFSWVVPHEILTFHWFLKKFKGFSWIKSLLVKSNTTVIH